jgi:hypothetical protein
LDKEEDAPGGKNDIILEIDLLMKEKRAGA